MIKWKGRRGWIALTYFLLAAAPGSWLPVLANILEVRGWGHLTTWAFFVLPVSGMISPLLFAAKADQKIAAEKLLGGIVLGGSVFLYLAFRALEHAEHPGWFLLCLFLNGLITAPAWSLLTTVTLTSLEDRERDFGRLRVFGTLGWMAAGWLVSFLGVDASPSVAKLAIGARLLAGLCCFQLPHTPPRGKAPRNLGDAMGLGALRILKDRDMAVFFLTAFLFSIPLAAFYMHTPTQLAALGWERVAAGLTVGQGTEVAAMFLMGFLLTRWRIKWLLFLALAFGALRYGLYAVGAGHQSALWLLAGVACHGFCWTFYFEAGRVFLDKRVEPEIRAQTQALMSLVTGGIGALVGTLIVGGVFHGMVDTASATAAGAGWLGYWLVLTAMCLGCLLLFLVGYRGRQTPG